MANAIGDKMSHICKLNENTADMGTKVDKSALKNVMANNNLMDFFPILLNLKDKQDWKITPSQFIKEINLTTEERYRRLTHSSFQDKNLDYPGITVTPKILVFQSFESRKNYTLLVQIRNCRKILLPLKVICPDSMYFSIKFAGTPMTKIAPGLSVEYEVTFTPSETRDYSHNLVLKTEDDTFYVPIIAIGPRPLLDIPDEITIPPAPVKISTTKTVIVRNIGTIPANFTFITRGCFKVKPAKGVVRVQEILELSIIFESSVTGDYSEVLYLNLESGEKLAINLYASAENVRVRLDKSSIIHDDTFVGLKRCKVFHIQNNSHSLIRYSWKRNKTMKEDLDIIESMRDKYEAVKDLEVLKDMKQIYYNICSHQTHKLAWERILSDELRLLQQEQFNFQHPNFKIEPESGQIFPRSQAEILVFFEPTKCGPVTAEAYLEVSGRDERLTLDLKGNGLGPLIVLSIEVVDIDFIFLCSVHTYEIVVMNKGDINGTIRFKQEPLVFGGKVDVLPNERVLKASEHAAFIISFTSNRQGEFTEKLNFEIVESGEILTLILKGKIVSPTLHFDKTHIDFGIVPLGFPISKEVTLSNLSMVPVTFSLRILSDGIKPSISCDTYGKLVVKPSLPKNPREFRIHPNEGVVEPFSSRTVNLTLIANTVRKWTTNLVVDMWDSETETVTCPIRLNSQTAIVKAEPKTISIPFCFINFPYTRVITLENVSRISAFFYIIPQEPNKSNSITYTTNICQGVIEPKGTTKVLLTIFTNSLGRQTLPLNMLIFGNESSTEICQICCVGQGPVVTLNSNVLPWGELQLLQESTKYLTIKNESPISANFTVTMTKSDSPWIVSPSLSSLEPGKKVNLNVSLLLRDRGKYQDTMKIQIHNGKILSCTTTAVGIGNNLLFEPNIIENYNWGTLFSHKKYSFKIIVRNEGTKPVGVIWCPIEDFRQFVNMKFINPPDLLFKMEPTKVDLPGGSSKTLALEVYSNKTGSFTQRFHCHANVDPRTKGVYMKSDMSAEFVEPIIMFDKSELHFYYNVGASGIDEKLSDVVSLINVSILSLSVNVTVNKPFYLQNGSDDTLQRQEIELAGNETKEIFVGFRTKDNMEKICSTYKDKLNIIFKESSKKLTLSLIGEINYPNVIVMPKSVDFGCIPVGTSAYREFILVNVSPIVVHYTITWAEKPSVIRPVEVLKPTTTTDIITSPSTSTEFVNTFEEAENNLIEVTTKLQEAERIEEEREVDEKCEEELLPPRKPVLTIPEIKIAESEVRDTIFPLVRKYYSCDQYLMDTCRESQSSGVENRLDKPTFMKLFDITPFFGRLESYESQVITICFQASSAVRAHVEAHIDIISGPRETMKIEAKAADLEYSLSTVYIDFGRQLFCDTATEYLKIRNTSLLEFDFETNTIDPVALDVNGDIPIEAGVLIITPRTGHIPAKSEKALRIRYHPGLPGKFEETFQLRIGYLEPIIIYVSGLAVFPQVHFDLPRTEINSIPVEIGYAAVSSITSDWLLTQSQQGRGYGSSPTRNFENTKEAFQIPLKLDDTWTVIDSNENLPTDIDFELAVERILAFKLLSKENRIQSNVRSIPNFFVPAYEIDFGVVTIGRSVSKSFIATNCGPLPAILYVSAEKNSKNWVMNIKMKNRHEIKIGGTTQITINCDPKRSKFVEQYEKIDYTFFIEVYQGAKIPIKASAVVTYPFVTPSCKTLNFGEVKCGNSKSMFMKLTNFGWVPALWFLSFRLTPKEMTVMHQSGILDGRPMFRLAMNKGLLHPNESCLLKISFKPEFGGKFSASMIIKVEEGFDEHRVLLTAEAVEPRLKISDMVITFEPTLPYPRNLFKYVTIQNPCPFPIEIFFPDMDEQIYEEDRILRALTFYYQTNELLLPARNPGEKLPNEIIDFYNYLLESVNAKYIGKMREKRIFSIESGSLMITPSEDTSMTISEGQEKKKIKPKRGSSSSRPRSSVVVRSVMNLPQYSMEGISIFRDKTPEEIEEMLTDYLKSLPSGEARFDPIRNALLAAMPPRKGDPSKPMPGLVIIFHAAPYTNLVQFSKVCSQIVDKQPLNIDRIVLEEVALLRCDAAFTLRGIIDKNFAIHCEGTIPEDEMEPEYQSFKDTDGNEAAFQKVRGELKRKICELFLIRDGVSSGFQGENVIEEKLSFYGNEKKDKQSAPNVKWGIQPDNILEGCDDLVYQILKFRFCLEASTGIVVENLQSRWISNPVTALKSLIKAADNIKDILVICSTKSYDKFKERIDQLEQEEEKEKMLLREEALRILEEEPEEEFDAFNLDTEEKRDLYYKFLNIRHSEYNAYLKMTEERACARKMGKNGKKQGMTPTVSSSQKAHPTTSHKNRDKSALQFLQNSPHFKERERPRSTTINNGAKSAGKDGNRVSQFLNFEKQLQEICNFLEFWDRRLGISIESQSPRGKRSSTPRRRTITDESDSRSTTEIGVHLWLIDENNWKTPATDSICTYLSDTLKTSRKYFDTDSWTSDIPESMMFSVVTSPPHRHSSRMLDSFSLVAIDRIVPSFVEDEPSSSASDKIQISDSRLSVKERKGSSDIAKKESQMLAGSRNSRSKKSLTSTQFESIPFKSRLVLQEGESASWCVQFNPTKIGRCEQFYPINLVSSPAQNNYIIKCTGICDIPRLDMKPENIFSSVAAAKPQDLIYSPTFFYSNYYFDFGSVIPNQVKDGSHNGELHSIFSLTNVSSLPVELTVMFADDALRDEPIGSRNFDIQPSSAYLKPDQTFLLNVYANPSKYGGVQEVLMLFVKGNPKIETIRIKCYGVKVSINIEPKVIDFDRMLLYRRDKKTITFTNSNLIPLFIALSGYHNLPPQFSFSAVKSWVQPLMSFTIFIEYEASEVQVISEEVVNVLVYDRVEAVEPVQTLSFTISAEAYDASIDIFFASRDDDHVDFEEMRILEECVKTVTLRNTGKYLLGFKIEINYALLEKIGNEEFYVTPDEGKLPIGKFVLLEIHFQAYTEVNWRRLPIFKIILMEPYNKDELVASIPIQVSAKSFYSRYIIQPISEVNFGAVEVGSSKNVTLSIENQGQFSFTYSIEPVRKSPVLNADLDTKKRTSETSSKEKTKKQIGGYLKMDSFEITPSSGVVAVKETENIIVNFSPADVKHYEELVIVKISESPPPTKDGNEMKIIAEGCLPQLNLNDFHSIFREHHVKTNETELPLIPDIGYHTIFTIEDQQFWFKNVCLCKTVDARLHLQNKGQIDCHVAAVVNKADGKRNYSLNETENDNFWVKPIEMIIPPYEYGTFVLSFRPDMLQSYRSQLTLTLRMPEKHQPSTVVISLIAVACIPQIEIVEPSLRSVEGQGLVIFPPTTPGRFSSSVISFKNTGKIESKVVVELNSDEREVFSIVPSPECQNMLKAWETPKPIDYTTVVTMQPEETARFIAIFKPTKIRKYTCEIKLFVVDNGYENLCYQLSGDSFLEEVVLERIQTTMPFAQDYLEDGSSYSQTAPGQYSIDLGHCFVNKKRKILARLSNKTEKDYFKFEWMDVPSSITVHPTIGHLYPGTYKEVYFLFFPQESIELEEARLACSLQKIQFPNPPPAPSWDSRLIHIMTNETDSPPRKPSNKTSSRQEISQTGETYIYGHEPEHDVIPNSNREVVLYMSALADYAYLHCETTVINFADTFMFQNRTFSLALENTGNVAFDYKLELKSVTYEALTVDESVQADFTSLTKRRSSSGSKAKSESTEKRIPMRSSKKPQPLGDEPLLDLRLNPTKEGIPDVQLEGIRKEEYNPFHLENWNGTILPKQKIYCQVVFSPLDVYKYKAVINIRVDNTHPDLILPEIEVYARSVMPYCHFDLSESDYITSGRRDYSKPGPIGTGPGVPLDPEVKTIEIPILGVRVIKPIHFHAINPTDSEYRFTWANVTQNQPGVVQSLHCTFTDGSIQPGRQKLMEFVFVSHTPGIFEYFWKFCIPEHDIEVLFLFVVVVHEPVMYFLSNSLIMHPTSVGATVTDVVTLINQDDVSSDFMFLPDSLYSEGRLNSLKVQPLSGKIDPRSEVHFRISFTGKTGGKIIFQLKFKLKKLQNPIILTVETMTYTVEPLVTFEDWTKSKQIADPTANNVIDFGKEMQIDYPKTIKFHLTNASKLSFYYEWLYDRKELVRYHCSLRFSNVEGHVTSQSRGECDLTIAFTKKSSLTGFPIKLKIVRGPVYNFMVNASATSPVYEFSFTNYDFGYCHVQNTDFTFYETCLTFRNRDMSDIFLESKAESLCHFTCGLNECTVQPGKDLVIPIKFYPKECVRYEEIITFRISGLYEKVVTLSGQGTEFKVSLANISDSIIRMTAIQVGSKHSRTFSIVNKGLAAATLLVGFSDKLPVNLSHLAHPNDNPIDVGVEPRHSTMLTVSPSKPFTLRPKETLSLKVECAPQKRMSSFSETICMQFQERVDPLCVVTGSSVGPEFSLDKKYLTFGAVVANCSSSLKLKIINSGDIGAKFKWESETPDSEFSVSPQCGYLSAESDVVINVTFHPKIIQRCIRKTMECKLFISDTETHPSLLLKLSGDCVDLPRPVMTLQFKCEVRSLDTKTIEIINRTGTDWRLMPTFSGEFFCGLDAIFVQSMSSAVYEITYSPLVMASTDDPHKSTLFFCLPDGSGQLYELYGVSLPPSACEVIEREVPCKTKYTELLKVKNWLRSHQRFKVTRTCESPEDLVQTCSGVDVFDIVPLGEKDYKIVFHAYKTGKLRFTVTFTNEETNEYVWYDITFNVVMCGPLEVITLKSAVRQLCHHEVKVQNPLSTSVQFKAECTNPEVIIHPINPSPPGSAGVVKIAYRPLHPGEKKEQLKVYCSELGIFPMEVRLVALEPAPLECIRFEASLGSADVQTIHVPNYHNSHAVLYCRTTSTEFKIDEKVNVGGLDSAAIDIIYEPSSLGKTVAALHIESDNAGKFIYPLHGNSVKPLAKGPFIVKSGSAVSITFKNVLKEPKIFQIYVDNPSFSVKSNMEEIQPGNELKISVWFQKSKNGESSGTILRCPVMGQLVVECSNPRIKWQFYLKGIADRASKN